MILKSNIYTLFDDLWPGMLYMQQHKVNCINQYSSINNYFLKYSDDHNKLLKGLCTLDGVGLTIASGLIWSVYPEERVPFDKYTFTYALFKRIIRTEEISNDYVGNSLRVKEYCNSFVKKKYTIESFVREAMIKMEGKFLYEPRQEDVSHRRVSRRGLCGE